MSVELCEVGPRDGIQFEERPFSTDLKLEIIDSLVEAGISRVQATSFVHPKWVPQMADAEAIAEAVTERTDAVFTALALNRRGVERAIDSGFKAVDLSIATNERHSRDNANMSVEDGVEQAIDMIDLCNARGVRPQLGFQTVFGFEHPGDTSIEFVRGLAESFCKRDIESLSLADSTGMANPVTIRKVVDTVSDVTNGIPIVLHLHDTRGLGLANVFAGFLSGVTRFDTSVGGMGGCPFIPGATGNIATEDTAYLLESMGIETGIDINAVASVARKIAEYLGKDLSGRLHTVV